MGEIIWSVGVPWCHWSCRLHSCLKEAEEIVMEKVEYFQGLVLDWLCLERWEVQRQLLLFSWALKRSIALRWYISCALLCPQVLLVSSSRHPDRWIVPGGGMEPEEEPNVAAVREVCEEVSDKNGSSLEFCCWSLAKGFGNLFLSLLLVSLKVKRNRGSLVISTWYVGRKPESEIKIA